MDPNHQIRHMPERRPCTTAKSSAPLFIDRSPPAGLRTKDFRSLLLPEHPASLAGCGKKEFPPPAPSLWSLPKGEKLRKAAFPSATSFYPGCGTPTSA